MRHAFGKLVTARRAALRLTLRDCAIRSGISAGNLSKIERGRLAPPQNTEVLSRLSGALELDSAEARKSLMDVASIEKGRAPAAVVKDADLAGSLPLLLPTVSSRPLDETGFARLLEMIRDA